MNKNHNKVVRMVTLALLAAIEVVLTLFPIQVGTISLNLGLTPIILAAVVFGPIEGCAIGAVSGIVTGIQLFTVQSPFYAILINANPALGFILCVAKTALAGLVAGLFYKAFCKFCNVKIVNMIAASAICPVVNTGVFAIGMFTVFSKALMANELFAGLANGSIVVLVFVVLIGANFFIELILNAIAGPAVIKAVQATKIIK